MYEPDTAPVETPELTKILCGRSCPVFSRHSHGGHQTFQLVRPTLPCSEKDWQQLAVIRKMVRELNMPIRIEGRPLHAKPMVWP